jgi:hypothetical protein
MNDSQDRPGLFLCPPGLAIKIEPATPLERYLLYVPSVLLKQQSFFSNLLMFY